MTHRERGLSGMEKIDYIICHLVEELPIPPVKATVRKCTECKRPVWLSEHSMKNVDLICFDCVKNRRVEILIDVISTKIRKEL